MQTLQVAPSYTVTRELLAPTLTALSGGAVRQAQRQTSRPLAQFTLRLVDQSLAAAEYLYSFAAYHQGDVPFWWDGGVWGNYDTPVLFGTGDGVTTEFFLPNRWIISDLLVYADTVLVDPAPTLDDAVGLATFADPPAEGSLLTATYQCRYQVVFWLEGETLLLEDLFEPERLTYEGIRLRECVP